MLRLLLIAAVGVGLTEAARASDRAIPTVLEGRWTIVSVEGADPMLLGVSKGSELIGQTVQIQQERLAISTTFTGIPASYSVVHGDLGSILSVPAQVSASNQFADDAKKLEFFELGLRACTSDGQDLNGCPAVTFSRDPATGQVSLVTAPWGLAKLRPASR